LYRNRVHAGELLLDEIVKRGLAESLSFLFAIPRGGIEVAYPIARGLKKEVFPLIVHKIPSSVNEEFAIGAISITGDYILNEYGREEYLAYIESVKGTLLKKLKKMEEFFGEKINFEDIEGKNVAVIDDGIATGETIFLGVKTLRHYKPKEILVLVPVSSLEGFEKLSEISTVICPLIDRHFYAVSSYFEEFLQVQEEIAKRYVEETRTLAK